MGLRLKTEQKDNVVSFKDMKKGDIGVIIDTYNTASIDRLVMKILNGIVVSLADGVYWRSEQGREINVRLLPPGTEFVID